MQKERREKCRGRKKQSEKYEMRDEGGEGVGNEGSWNVRRTFEELGESED